jgi:hypothetical protein
MRYRVRATSAVAEEAGTLALDEPPQSDPCGGSSRLQEYQGPGLAHATARAPLRLALGEKPGSPGRGGVLVPGNAYSTGRFRQQLAECPLL